MQRPTAKALLEHRFVKNARGTVFLNELLARLNTAQLNDIRAAAGDVVEDGLTDYETKASAWAFEADSTYRRPTLQLPSEVSDSTHDYDTSSSATLRTAQDFGNTIRPGMEGDTHRQSEVFELETIREALAHLQGQNSENDKVRGGLEKLSDAFEALARLDGRVVSDFALSVSRRLQLRP